MESSQIIHLTIPGQFKFLNIVNASITALFEHLVHVENPDALSYQVRLAVHEVCANIIDHAYDGMDGNIHISLTVSPQPSQLIVDIKDKGSAFIISDFLHKSYDEPQTRGYGLILIYQLMDDIDYFPEAGNNHWHLVKYLS